MARAGVEKYEMKYVIKTYILCNGPSTANELAWFVNNHFNFLMHLSGYDMAGILKDSKQGILKGLRKSKCYSPEEKVTRMVYYFE